MEGSAAEGRALDRVYRPCSPKNRLSKPTHLYTAGRSHLVLIYQCRQQPGGKGAAHRSHLHFGFRQLLQLRWHQSQIFCKKHLIKAKSHYSDSVGWHCRWSFASASRGRPSNCGSLSPCCSVEQPAAQPHLQWLCK